MLIHIQLGLRHAFEVFHCGPSAIGFALALGQLRLNVNDGLRPLAGLRDVPLFWRVGFPAQDHSADFILRVPIPERGHADVFPERRMAECEMLAALDRIPLRLQQAEKGIEVMRLFGKRGVDGLPQQIPARRFPAEPLIIAVISSARILNDGKLMLNTNHIAQPCDRSAGTEKIPELVGAVQRGGVPDNMIVDMPAIRMGTDDKSVFAFQKTGSEVIADLVRLLRRDLTGLEGLTHLIGDHIIAFFSAGEQFVLALGQKKFRVGSPVVAGIGGDQFAALGLLWVF